MSYRYGEGWVTLSSLPLLQHFQDVRARVYLMNLLKAVARRKPWVPPSPGLAWLLQQRMTQWPAQGNSGDAVYYRGPPSGIESAPMLVPLGGDGDACWTVPAAAEAGATLTLELGAPRTLNALRLRFGAGTPPLRFAGSHDGRDWTLLPPPAPGAGDAMDIALPGQSWAELRLTTAAAGPAWKLCQMSAQ